MKTYKVTFQGPELQYKAIVEAKNEKQAISKVYKILHKTARKLVTNFEAMPIASDNHIRIKKGIKNIALY